ncbi:unnamed protein product, partial [Didymodactylos carnosus]
HGEALANALKATNQLVPSIFEPKVNDEWKDKTWYWTAPSMLAGSCSPPPGFGVGIAPSGLTMPLQSFGSILPNYDCDSLDFTFDLQNLPFDQTYQNGCAQNNSPNVRSASDGNDSDTTDLESDIDPIQVNINLIHVNRMQDRFRQYGIGIGEEYSRITSILNIPPLISLTETARERKVRAKKYWYFSLLLEGVVICAYVSDGKKNEAKRKAYNTMISLFASTRSLNLKPVKNNKFKVNATN